MNSTISNFYQTQSLTFSTGFSTISPSEVEFLLTEKKLWNFEESEAKELDSFFQGLFQISGIEKFQFENTLRNTRSTGVVRYPYWFTDETKISVKRVSDGTYLVEINGTNFGNRFSRSFYCLDLGAVKSLDYKRLQYA
ncbi:hypothetical protein EBU71_02275 [bacterium]|nr:hypothetical protein [Candidatus Elulimicrobium humile]